MSNHYDLACATCADSRCGFDVNHGGEGFAELLRARPQLTALGRWLRDREATKSQWRIDGSGTKTGVYADAAIFLAKHEGHDVYVRDEYGHRFDECSSAIDCASCGHRDYCHRPVGHDGEHAKERAP